MGSEVDHIGLLVALFAVPVLVFVNGFFVAAEFALVSVRKTRIEEMVNAGVVGASKVQKVIQNLDQTIAATQLGITIASIGLGFVGEPAAARIILPLFQWVAPFWKEVTIHGVATFIAFVGVTFIHVVFGELIPKTLALRSPEKASLAVSPVMLLFNYFTLPVIRIMNGTALLVIRRMGISVSEVAAIVHSVEELKLLIEDTEEAGILEAEQATFLQNVFQLSSKTVSECMIPREKMGMIELNLPFEQVMERIRDGGHTRMPVFDKEIDNIVGIVNTKDLFYLISAKGVVVLEDALYPVIYLKPNATIAFALKTFKNSHRHMAVVRDEESQKVLGLITFEDILEEIVGEIEDEHDRPEGASRIFRATIRKRSS
ncbi:MAG: HlyC/CorC family transporter [Planctomycetes bacterium]|nr:HlyC/CorC family transporter [Planctomycetota bacterium]